MDLLSPLIVRHQGEEIPALTAIHPQECSQSLRNMTPQQISSSQDQENVNTQKPSNEFSPPPSAQPVNTDDQPRFSYPLQSLDEFQKEDSQKTSLFPLQSKSNSDSIAEFYQRCQSHGLQPTFTTSEPFKGGFTAKVVFGEFTEEIKFACPSKQAAKNAVCKVAIERLPAVQKFSGTTRGTKRKASYTDVIKPQLDTTENWIGLLLEHSQQEKLARPEFTELATYSFPTQYACTLKIADRPDEPFGSEALFPTKQGAKATAAKEAVLWLRENGKLPAAGIKRRKTLDTKALGDGNTGLTQILGNFGVEESVPIGKRVHEKVIAMEFCQPTYHLDASTLSSGQSVPVPGYWDISVTFDARDVAKEPRLGGRIAEMKHVYGKQKAKDACAEKVLELLESF